MNSYIIIAGYTIYSNKIKKYICISSNWDTIKQFYRNAVEKCGYDFYYYLVKIGEVFDLEKHTYNFNIENLHQIPKSMAMYKFNDLINDLVKPELLDRHTFDKNQTSVKFYINQKQKKAVIDMRYNKHKSNIFIANENKKNEMKSYKDFNMLEEIVNRHNKFDQYQKIYLNLNESIYLNDIVELNFL